MNYLLLYMHKMIQLSNNRLFFFMYIPQSRKLVQRANTPDLIQIRGARLRMEMVYINTFYAEVI